MDNLAAHKTNAVKEQFDNICCNAIFSAPYSPEFNCIELYFSLLFSIQKNYALGFFNLIKLFN